MEKVALQLGKVIADASVSAEGLSPQSSDGEFRYIEFREFVRRVPLSASTIRRRLKDGSIPYVQPGGRGHSVLIREDALDRVQPAGAPEQETEGQPVIVPDATLSIAVPPEQPKLPGPAPRWKTQGKFRR